MIIRPAWLDRIFRPFCLSALALLVGTSVGAAPFQLDWDAQTWTPEGNGNLSESLPVGNHNVVVTFSGNTADLDQDAGGGSPIAPSINSQNTGGLMPIQEGLYIGADYVDDSNPSVTITIDFSQYPGGVSGVSFTMFDIDALSSFTDRAVVTAVNGGGTINPTSRGTNASNQLVGANGIEGTAGSGADESFGNATFTFAQSGITSVTIVYSNEIGTTNPGFQFVNIHDIDFDAQVADIGIVKTASSLTPVVGTNVTFTLVATNDGPDNAPSVEITDLLPAGYAYVSDTGGGAYTPGTGVWDIGALADGASDTIDIVATVNASGPYANTATVTDVGVDDGNAANDSSTVTPVPILQADLSLTNVVDETEPLLGSNVTFTVTLTNDGPSGATGVVVGDLLPAGYSFVSATASQGGYLNGTGVWSVGAIADGAVATLTITATVLPGGGYESTAQVTASDQGDIDSTPNNNQPAEDDQDSATVTPVSLGLAKRLVGAPTSNGDGSYDASYTLVLSNTGATTINAVQVSDALSTTFAGAGFSVLSLTSPTLTVNGGYNGAGDTDLLSGADSLAAGASATLALTVRVTPGVNLGPYDNSASASGASPGGTAVGDTSANGANVDPNADGDPANDASPTPVSFVEEREIGAAKAVSVPLNNGDGTYDITYTLVVENTGDVPLSGVQLTDNLTTTFSGASFVAGTPSSADLSVNAGFNGGADINLLDGSDTLATGASGTLTVTVTVTPGANFGPYNNAALASGTAPSGNSVSDLSTDGNDVDPDGNGNPGNNSVPTPVLFDEAPAVGIAKALTSGPTPDGAGNYALAYTLTVENLGDVTLDNIQVTEDLAATFAGATVSAVGASSADFTVDPAFNGIGAPNVLDGSDTLLTGQSGTLVVTLTVTPGANLGPYDNSATVDATSPAAVGVSDTSTLGTDPDPDNDGDANDNSVPTPVTFSENPQLGLAKAIGAGPANNGDGSYTLTYSVLIENTGDVELAGVQANDDLAATFAGATFTVDNVLSGDFTVDPGFNGVGTTTLLAGTDTLAAGGTGTLDITVTVTPGASLGPYANIATGSATSPAGAVVNDASTDGTDVDPDNNGDPGNDSVPTPVTFVETPQIGVAKALTAGPNANGDGSFTLTYTLTLENLGDVSLTAVQIVDDLTTTFAAATSFVVDSVSSTDFAVDVGFDGDGNQNILAGSDTLAIGASGTVAVTVTVTPGADLGPYDNAATASGSSPSGAVVNDVSTDGADPDPDNDNNAGNNADPTPVSFIEMPEIGVAKAVSAAPVNDGAGNFTLTYRLRVNNSGDVPLTSLQVNDDLAATFAGATSFSVDSVSSATLAVNAGYDGSGDTALLDGSDTLAPGATAAIDLVVTVTAGANLGPYDNSATASATSPGGTPASDISQSGANPDPDGNGDPGDNAAPTPVSFNEAPQVGAAKALTAGPTSNGDGTFSLTYTVTVENTGDVTLSGVQVDEDFDTTFANAGAYTVDSVTSGAFSVNAGFDGSAATGLLDGSDTLAVGASGSIAVSVTVTPGADLGPYENQATAQGTSPGGTPVSDDSTDGTDVDPDGNGNPGNDATPTPVTFVETPQIGTAKALAAAPVNNGDGTYTLTYSILVENTGDVDLQALQVTDNLMATFGAAVSFTVDNTASPSFALNPNFDGDGDRNLLIGSGTLAAGAAGTLTVTVTVRPGASLGPYNNTAVASGTSPGGTPVSDVSTSGADVDPDNDGNPGDNSAPTPVSFSEMPQIGLAKVVAAAPLANGDGSATLTYLLTLENTGDVALDSVQIGDDLSTTFAGAVAFGVASISSGDFAINPLFNGDTNQNLLVGSDTLAAGASGSVTIEVQVTPGANLGPYENTATVTAIAPSGGMVADDSTDGIDVDPDNDGDPTNNAVPTPVTFTEMPVIGIAKRVASGPDANGDGSFTVAYGLRVENLGDVALSALQVEDSLAAAYAGAVSFAVDSISSTDFAVNGGFDGDGDVNLLAGTDTLAIGAGGDILVTVTVIPGMNLGPYDNSAEATATSPGGAPANDTSVEGAVPDSNGNGDPGDDTGPTSVTFAEMPEIGLAKSVSTAPVSNGDGTFTLVFTLLADNSGDVPVEDLQISDNLAATFAGANAFTVDATSSTTLTVNPGYDGAADSDLLAGSDTLGAGVTATVRVTVTVEPGANLGPYLNTATVSGASPAGVPVSDVSQSGGDPDPDADGNPGNNDQPTPVSFNESPEIGAAKALTAGPTSNGDGTFTLTYTVVVDNSGDVDLTGVQVVEDFDTTFAAAATYVVDSLTSANFAVNPAFDGGAVTTLLDGSDALAVGTGGTVDIVVTVTPGTNLGPYANSVTAVGTSPGGTPVSDESTDGATPDGDGDGSPGNDDTPTSVTFSEAPLIGTAKRVSTAPVSNGDGTFTLTYTITARNSGDVTLSSVQIDDNLSVTFAAANSFSVDALSSPQFAVNPAYDGDTDTNLLLGTGALAPTASGSVLLTVTVSPGTSLGPYDNTATASGDSPGGTSVTDASQSGSNVDPDNDGDPGNNNTPTPVTFSEAPRVGAAKAISSPPLPNGDGSFTLTYRVRVRSTGDVALSNLQLDDDLAATFASADDFSVVSVTSASLAVNPNYDGEADTGLLAGVDTLATGATASVDVTVNVMPGMTLGPYANSATVSGTSPGGTTVSDASQSGTDIDPDADGDPTNNDDPTPVTFMEMPVIGVAKTLSVTPTSNGDGTFDFTYRLLIVNSGDVGVMSLQLSDNLAATFAAANGFTVNAVTSNSLAVNPNYDGDGDVALLIGADTLAPGASASVQIALTVEPGANLGPYSNTATADAVSTGGMPISDVSQSGVNPDPDGNGNPGDNGTPTQVSFDENPQIGAAKEVTSGPINNGDGSFTVSYNVVLANTGDVPIEVLQITEDLNATFPGVAALTVDSVSSDDFAPNPNFDGVTDTNLLGGADMILPGSTSSAALTVTLTPSTSIGPFSNIVVVSGETPNGTPVADDSTAGPDPDPDGDGPGNDGVGTEITLPVAPGLGVAEQIGADPVNNGDGSFTLVYTVVVENTGDLDLTSLQVTNPLAATFQNATSLVIDGVTSPDFAVNPNFDGDTDINLLAGSDVLPVGASGAIEITVTVTPGTNLGPYDNMSMAEAEALGGLLLGDASVDGADVDPDGDGDPGNDTSPTSVVFPGALASLSGKAWIDANLDDAFDAGEQPLSGWLIQVTQAGVVVATVPVGADGDFTVADLPPGPGYTISLLNPDNNAVFGVIDNLTLPSGATVIDQNLPIDPSGVVYDSDSRQPIAGATVTLTDAGGAPLPNACLLPDQQSQVTGATGWYRFDLIPDAEPACPSGATYVIAVTSPTGYLDGPSLLIPPQNGPFSPTGLANPFAVAPQPGAPQGAEPTTYYLSFLLRAGDPNVVNNHIALDPPGGNIQVRVTKTAGRRTASIGELVPYTLAIENVGLFPITGLTVSDLLPAGFSFVAGSARLVGAGTLTVDGQRPVNFGGIALPVDGEATVRYILRVGAGVVQGDYTNVATPLVAGVVVGNAASATVAIIADPDIEQTTIVGKVFHDLDGDGYQDSGEVGIPGVRLATVEGLLIETDAYGRYHLAGVDGGFMERGRNFIIKVDAATLPDGAQFTTENPRVKRITQGLMNRFDFGVQLPGQGGATGYRKIAVKLGEVFFKPGSADVRPEFGPLLDELAERLQQHGGGRLIFAGNDSCRAAKAAGTPGSSRESAGYTMTARFGVRKAGLTDQERANLERIAADWANARDLRVRIEGHTSNVPIAAQNRAEFADNYALARSRARSVADYLTQILPLAPTQIEIDVAGPDRPVASNASAAGREQNRRVELTITGIRGAASEVAPATGNCDPALARERAKRVFELLRSRLGDCEVCEIELVIGDEAYEPYPDSPGAHLEPSVEKEKMNNGRIAGLLRGAAATALGLFVTTAHAQGAPLGDCTIDSCNTGNGYAIQIVGFTDDRPASPYDTVSAMSNDNRVDVSGEFMQRLPGGGTLWATEDPAAIDPRIAVHADDSIPVENGALTAPLEFFVYKNYDAFIERAVLEIYHERDFDRLAPLASLPLPEGVFVSVEWDGGGHRLQLGDELFYLVKAYDAKGRLDRTLEKSVRTVTPAAYTPPDREALPRTDLSDDARRGRANAAVAGSPLKGKVAVMKPPLDSAQVESVAYRLTPHFDTRKTILKPEDRAELDRIIANWNGATDVSVYAEGHTDRIRIAPEHVREFANNQVLSEARAAAVAEYIATRLNVHPDDVTAVGRGKSQPVASNDTVAGRAKNRRVELRITGKRTTMQALAPLAVELVDPFSGKSVPISGTLEEALNILTAQTGDTTPGFGQAKQGRRLDVDCRVAQTRRHELQAVYGRNELVKRNIPLYGSRVRLHGADVDGNHAMQVNGRMVPIDTTGQFVVEYMLPVGKHAFDVEFMDESCVVRDQTTVPVDVSGKHMFIVALADFTMSGSDISGSVEPLSANDRYDEDFLVEGRLAFYLKGKVKGKYLVTAQLDTKEEEIGDLFSNLDDKEPRSIFRRLDPDRYYPVYGDDSTTRADTDSIGKMYVRADWDKSTAQWGNFHTGFTGTEFVQYNRSLYGGQLVWNSMTPNAYGDSRTETNVFVSENQTELGHSEFIGTGGSLYYLKHTDLLPGSEKLRVEIRDRDSERVLENVTLTRGVDYEIDEIQGRVILSRPLMQITQLLAPTLIKDSPLDGNSAILIADYEYIPVGFNPDHVGVGARGKHWFGDHVAIGGTYVSENRGGGADDYTLAGVDVTMQAAPNTYLKVEYASSEENQVERYFSNDGGLRFSSLANTTVAGRDGDAYAIEGRVNTREWLGSENEWVLAGWYRHSDEGFSIARRDNGVDTDEYGAQVVGQVGERWTVTGSASVVERETQRDSTRYSLQTDYRLSDVGRVTAEVRRVDDTTNNVLNSGQTDFFNRTEQGSGTLGALRYTRQLGPRWSVYAGGQVSLSQDDGYDNNDLGTVGVVASIGERTSLGAEYSSGHRGNGASMTLDHALNERHRVYGTYTHSTDTTETFANDQIAIGQRAAVSNQLSVFNEHQFSNYRDNRAGIAHVFGLDYALPSGWSLGATFQTGDLENGVELVTRDAIAGSVGFKGNRLTLASRIEWREDSGDTADAKQYVTSNRIDYRYSRSTRFLGRLNFSETEDNANPDFDAKFIEGQVGVAYRPVDFNRLNMLAKYTYLYDLRGFDQSQTNTDQRSNIWSVEGIYLLNPRWDVGAKYAYRQGELRTDRNSGDWFESTTRFFAVRGRYHLIRRWDALAEYRWLDVDEARSTRNGFLVALDRHFGQHMKLGIGYNFTDFSDDLTNLDYDHKGWFLNAVGKY